MSYAGPVSRGKRARIYDTPASPHARTSAVQSNRVSSRPRLAHVSDGPSDPLVFAAGVAVGIAVGAGAALLLAPTSGEDARHAIARRGRRLRRRSRDAWDDLRRELQRALARRKRRIAEKHAEIEDEELC